MSSRIEKDSMGEIEVERSRYWGAQTQRSLTHFSAGGERYRWRQILIRALAQVKKAAAQSNLQLGLLDKKLADAIVQASNEIIEGKLDEHFPLSVFQTGSGTHTNMNVNEVIANRAIEMLGGELGSKHPVHPNDHVNLGQSSNDVFPTAMHLGTIMVYENSLLPAIEKLSAVLQEKIVGYSTLVKSGRTHLQDAAPLTLGQEMSAWLAQVNFAKEILEQKKAHLLHLAIGGTAVGTGLNTHKDFGKLVAKHLEALTGLPFRPADNLFCALSAHDPLVEFSASLRTLAGALLKIANDVRWLASGPRCGIGELNLPQNEPGSSIMPGKVNPSQCEALSMVCVQVFGNDTAVAFAGSQGNFQLNAYKPLIIHNILESSILLANAIEGFTLWCLSGLTANTQKINQHLERNLMLVTALNKHIGYDKAASIAKKAERENLTLKEAALALDLVSEAQFDEWVVALDMTGLSAV